MAAIPDSKETPPVSGEEDEDEATIFCRVMCHGANAGCDWFVIKGGGSGSSKKGPPPRDQKALDPVFHQDSKIPLYSGVAAVGSTIYLLGGRLNDLRSPPLRDVYSIDTQKIDQGWKKSRFFMNKPRSVFPLSFTVNGKVYIMGGYREESGVDGEPPHISSVYPEVFDPHGHEGWRELKDFPATGGDVSGHAVLHGGERILVYSRLSGLLYCYDVGADSWCVYNAIPDLDMSVSVCVDGVLYYIKPGEPGVMYGLDVSKPCNLPKPVILGPPGKYDWDWIPQPYGYDWMLTPTPFLVSLGGGKLAAVWCDLWVSCSRIKMCKEINKATGEVDYVAYPLSFSVCKFQGSMCTDCLAVFPNRTSGAQEEDVSKDDNVVTTDNKNNTCGGNMLANDSNRRRRRRNKKKKNKGKSEVA